MADEVVVKPSMCIGLCDVPSVYSNKQSYYEVLCYINYKINECIDAINGFTDAYKKYTDQEIAKLKEYVDGLNNDMKEYVDGQVATLDKKIDDNYNTLDSKIDSVQQELQSNIDTLTNLVYKLNKDVYDYIETEINKLYRYIDTYGCKNIKCLNPTNDALNCPTASNNEDKHVLLPSILRPANIGPPETKIVGTLTLAAAINNPGTFLSQLGIITKPSN